MELSEELAGAIQQSWHRFLQRTESLRPDLHRYCRSLTGSVWDAEDLVQDTLLRGFAKLGEFSNPIDNPKAYLFRIATNLWVDRFRRQELAPPIGESTPSSPEQSAEIRDAARQLMYRLPPQERAVVVLKDVLDFRLDDDTPDQRGCYQVCVASRSREACYAHRHPREFSTERGVG